MDNNIVKFNENFKYVSELGSGGNGVVLKVVSKSNGKTYALKVINVRKTRSMEKLIEEWSKETRVLNLLEGKIGTCYKYIVCMVELYPRLLYKEKLCPAILTEYLDGDNLGELMAFLKRKPESEKLSKIEAKIMAIEMFSAMYILHFHGYVHRDVKLENFMMSKGVVKLIDFGYACNTKNNKEVICSRSIIESGSIYNEAPETYAVILSLDQLPGDENSYSDRQHNIILSRDTPKIKKEYKYLVENKLKYNNASSKDIYNTGLCLYNVLTQMERKTPFQQTFTIDVDKYGMTLQSVISNTMRIRPEDRWTAQDVLFTLGATQDDLRTLLEKGQYNRSLSSFKATETMPREKKVKEE